jgi:hypothetical protein
MTETQVCDRCGQRKLDIEFPWVEGRRYGSCWACAQPDLANLRRDAATRAEVDSQAGWTGISWVFAYPFGVFLLVAIEIGATIGERGCSRFGDCPGGLSDVFIVAIRALNGGPPTQFEWVLTIALVIAMGWIGWRRLGTVARPFARLQLGLGNALGRLILGRDHARRQPTRGPVQVRLPGPGERPRVHRPGMLRSLTYAVTGLVVWLAITSIGVVAPWVVALAVLVAVP